ncbi:histidine phosphotransferase family protein [Sphingopyxis granuli]|jgi:histidine phosphotransferase ChpT|uniref:histidine phosphotransferase family protein n=1 Tax=Sphingopyxis TaxID=165697 RepID=UPI00086EDE84|nr:MULTISPECIES: histidine phosphotransferase family protein [Sphingopyxis]APW73135.1 histidine phosphotransferase [Sphingopyxis granuli]AVA14153.1 histidine phosphotransferase [Sphingopyxis sp. MG]ODU35687.1 MAG: histidine phosphotransferase [Sphingopyxis sp. SCN 67-31]UNK78732.1 histidine phosphotransferase family protein [Sphingopyxis granuli]
MTDDRVDFASMLASRLCHDLLSPVGAFANGLELLADEQDAEMRARVFDLLEQSARTSANKLKFFRLAFGSAGGFGDAVPPDEAKAAIEGIMADRPIELNWMIADEPLPKPAVKIILNLALILVDALVRGGRLDIGCEKAGEGIEIALHAEAERILVDADVERLLSEGEGAAAMTSRTAPAALVQAVAAQNGGTVMLARETPTSLLVGAVLKGARQTLR